ncbi:MAG: hypothetical protein Q8914_09180, partial [Bacteroidota bacterium]|nr:hypothetical protein [Bacteroidota bacterium]
KDLIESVEVFSRERRCMETFSNKDCQFGYRDSIFKNQLKDKYVVCSVTYRLSKVFSPNIDYGDVARRLLQKGETSLTAIRQTILEIRSEKLPDPAVTGNAGSFFMNPTISVAQYKELQERFPDIPGWVLDNERVKVSAAWCIEKAGWKGKQYGHVGVHQKQPLVLINHGQASASEVIALSDKIREDVENLFGLQLRPEVMFI